MATHVVDDDKERAVTTFIHVEGVALQNLIHPGLFASTDSVPLNEGVETIPIGRIDLLGVVRLVVRIELHEFAVENPTVRVHAHLVGTDVDGVHILQPRRRDDPAVVWVHLNLAGHLVEGVRQVSVGNVVHPEHVPGEPSKQCNCQTHHCDTRNEFYVVVIKHFISPKQDLARHSASIFVPW